MFVTCSRTGPGPGQRWRHLSRCRRDEDRDRERHVHTGPDLPAQPERRKRPTASTHRWTARDMAVPVPVPVLVGNASSVTATSPRRCLLCDLRVALRPLGESPTFTRLHRARSGTAGGGGEGATPARRARAAVDFAEIARSCTQSSCGRQSRTASRHRLAFESVRCVIHLYSVTVLHPVSLLHTQHHTALRPTGFSYLRHTGHGLVVG